MNLIRVIASMDPVSGGPCQGLRNIIPVLNRQGINNEVVCLDAPSAEFLGKDSFPIYALGPAKSTWAYSEKLVPWLLENLSRYDVVIVHGLWLYHTYAVKRALDIYKKQQSAESVRGKLPVFYIMPHGMLDPYFQKAAGRKLKAIRNWIYWKLIESKVIRYADAVLFTCEQELLLAREAFVPYKPKQEICIGYGVLPPPAFVAKMKDDFLSQCAAVTGKKYFLFLSRVHPKKGVDLLIKAYLKLMGLLQNQDEFPMLVIAGPGAESEYGLEMKNLVEASGYARDRIIFVGMLTGNAKWGAFYGAEAFILPSHQENFGIAVVEALACRVPVMITNQINIYREVAAGNGALVEEDTVTGIENMLKTWSLLSPEEKSSLADNAYNTYLNLFTIEERAEVFKNLVLKS